MILIMLITVSLILMSYQWLLKYSPQTQQELEKNLLQKEGCLKIENIDTLNKKITIRNCGKNELNNFIIYIDDKPVGSYSNKLGAGGVIQISYTGYITPRVNHNIKVSSNYADSPIITFLKNCDIYITQSMIPYKIDKSDTYYCLNESVRIDNQNAINFSSGVQNSILDCQEYNIDGNNTANTAGVYLTGISTSNNIITNCNITDFYHNVHIYNGPNNIISNNRISNSDNNGIKVESTSNNVITDNIITMTKINSQGGIELSYSNNNIIFSNTITTSADVIDAISLIGSNNNIISSNTMNVVGSSSDGIWFSGSNYNTLFNNIITNMNPAHGIHISSSYNNNITGGSVISKSGFDYYLDGAGTTNNFTSTNFTAYRSIYFQDTTSWFNYNNETTGNIWLKTRISSATNLTRRLSDWSQTLMRWNDSTAQSVTATYNITGLTPNNNYIVYNNSIPIAGSPFNSGSNGQINFTINLSAGKEQEIKIVRTSYTISPLWFTNSTNNTIAGKPTLFSLYWTDDVGLSGYIFSTNNTGTWVNDIFTYFNITKTFGNNNNGTSSFTIGNTIMGKNYTIAENGISKSITARINTYGLARNVKCAIYDNSNNFVAETQENSVNTGSMAWVVFNFNISNQKLLYANQLYHLVCWTNGGTDLSATYIVGENTYRQSVTYGTWPKPYVPTLLSNTNKADIYVNYTPSNALFADGFESGNLNAWDGTAYSGGTLAVQNSLTYSGIYASNFTSMSTGAAVAYKAITPGTDYYISSYIRLSAMPTGSSPVVIGAGFAHSNSDVPSWALIAKPIVQLQGGNLYWGVRSIYGGGTSSQNYLESTPSKPTANTWYQVEMHLREGTSGQFQLWVNGVLKVNQTNVDNSARGNIGTACILLDSSYGAEPAMNLYVDDVVASASYINPENMGWSNVTKTLNSTAGNNVQWCVYANDTSNNWNMTSCVNPFSLITTSANCDNYISTIPYTINKNNTVYCLVSDLYIGSQNAINFSSGVQNTTLDCLGYNLDGNNVGYGVYLTGSGTKNNTIKNCIITDFYYGFYLSSTTNITIINNSIINSYDNGVQLYSVSNINIINNTAVNNMDGFNLFSSSSNNRFIDNDANNNFFNGFELTSSPNNVFINNNANNNGQDGWYIYTSSSNTLNKFTNNTANSNSVNGFYLYTSSKDTLDSFENNIAIGNLYGFFVDYSFKNNITGGSTHNNIYDYGFSSSGLTNNFTNTNFTVPRSVYFYDSSSWFNYNNETTGNIWLKTSVSAESTITRKLINWNNTLMQWNDSVFPAVTARYNVTGLISRSLYDIYNNSVLTYSDQYSGDSGILSFTINLPQNQWRNITVIWKIGMP